MAAKAPPKLAAVAGTSAGGSGAGQSAKELAASKRQKKREVDRRCQREARQRTKARIAYLEELVEELRQQDTSGQVASLMQQVAEARNERDQFARTLRGIEDSIRSHRDLLGSVQGGPPVAGGLEQPAESGSGASSLPGPMAPFNSTSAGGGGRDNAGAPMQQFSQSGFAHATTPALHHTDAYGLTVPIRREMILPPTDGPCPHCDRLENAEPRQQSLWRFSNSVLKSKPQLTAEELQWEDEYADDTPVRAVVEGWDATARRMGGSLPPLWRALKQIDEKLFYGVQPIERLAILRTMHLLYRYHADPTTQKAKIPAWFLARPSQNIEHSYAIDFFVWPGIRERFVFSEHSYCTDLFWHLVNKCQRILWQYDFRDCYVQNNQTGTYRVSPAFEERISDINAWTMGPEFFKQWPELYADIPSFEAVALPMNTLGPGRNHHANANHVNGFRKTTVQSMTMASVDDVTVDVDGADVHRLAAAAAAAAGTTSPTTVRARTGVIEDGNSDDEDAADLRQQQHSRRASHAMMNEHLHQQARANMMQQHQHQHQHHEHQAAIAAELSRIRGTELLPQHDWLWLTDSLADGHGLGDGAGLDGDGDEAWRAGERPTDRAIAANRIELT